MDAKELKSTLLNIKKNGYAVPQGITPINLAHEMLNQLGNPDPELRDDLIYLTFYNFIEEKNLFNRDEVRELVDTCLDNDHLFYNIGEVDNDSVFMRSFSALLLSSLINYHLENDIYSLDQLRAIMDRLCDYFVLEVDIRGYVDGKGWAHAIAHIGDTLNNIVNSPQLERSDLYKVLDILPKKICQDEYVYIHGEDVRLSYTVLSIVEQDKIPHDKVIEWFNKLINTKSEKSLKHRVQLKSNIRNFLRATYFHLLNLENVDPLLNKLKTLLKNY